MVQDRHVTSSTNTDEQGKAQYLDYHELWTNINCTFNKNTASATSDVVQRAFLFSLLLLLQQKKIWMMMTLPSSSSASSLQMLWNPQNAQSLQLLHHQMILATI